MSPNPKQQTPKPRFLNCLTITSNFDTYFHKLKQRIMQKKIFVSLTLFFSFQMLSFAVNKKNNNATFKMDSIINPLAKFSNEWNQQEYSKCNTAKDLKYISATDRDVICILNMARLNPALFLNSILLNPNSSEFKEIKRRNFYYNSLVEDLKILSPNQTPLLPDYNLFVSANCHAYESGKTGYVGHDRKKKKCEADFYGECCDYGSSKPIDIVMSLLIDEDVPSLGHRKIMLSNQYTLIGVSTQPHIDYRTNTVLDFK